MASSFSSSSPHTWKDNVFLSFYGPDVRQTFLSHLLNQFKYNGINFFDDQDIERRQITAPLFIEAIRESRISIIVLSKKYASSSWCLDELLEILNCRENWQKVIPVFYRVKHSDVRNQAGDFGNTFNETCAHKTEEVKMKWSHALTHVGNIAGVHVNKIWTNEAEMIELIVRHVSDKLWKYNVFTSFRGDDVRNKLISHLRNKFEDKGITMFDDSKIKKGHIISPALTEAIRESEIFIVVFSKNYASSSWCLNELLEILKFNKNEQRVIPVFHEVDPSHVRKQAGDFGIAFNETCAGKTEEERIKWSQALTYVGYIAGEHFQNWTNEAEMIENIAKHVLNKLRVKPSKNC